ncbi:hypothetical protein [Cupriavidus necator]
MSNEAEKNRLDEAQAGHVWLRLTTRTPGAGIHAQWHCPGSGF